MTEKRNKKECSWERKEYGVKRERDERSQKAGERERWIDRQKEAETRRDKDTMTVGKAAYRFQY